MSVKVRIYDKQKIIKLTPEMRNLIRKSCSAVLKCENIAGDFEVEVSVVDDEQIRVINNDCRGIDSATDVLSFPLSENGEFDINPETGAFMLGDIVISMEHAIGQADLYGHGTAREIAYLTVHSMLHLLGYDHVNSEDERAVMRAHEEAVLKVLELTVNKE